MNRLIREKSPYLFHHARNPVDWHPWGEEAFEQARREDKPVFLSIGYSTCHWCHVMEREVFEREDLAGLLNRLFVSVLVDREERPDVDRIYMSALQALSGKGGWPMSMFLTPDREPFYGATYIPPESFRQILETIHGLWSTNQGKVRASGRQLVDVLKPRPATRQAGSPHAQVLERGFQQFRDSYNARFGGFGSGPQFPRPAVLDFLLHFYAASGNREALDMTLATLDGMRRGGIYDHLGGGFHRYAVDEAWRVPHFEKMLYDQAQLAGAYLDAFRITRKDVYARIVRETLDYVLRDLTDEGGGFYCAEDSDSAPDAAESESKREGAAYTWTAARIERVLGKRPAEVFSFLFGIEPEGNVAEDPYGDFAGENILYRAHTIEEAAGEFRMEPEAIQDLERDCRRKLLKERETRPRPHRDEKVLVSWNGLMISALARAYQVLNEPAYLRAARKCARFIFEKMEDARAGVLLRRYSGGEVRFDAHLEDYSFLTLGLMDLYQASFEIEWLRRAVALTERQIVSFWDRDAGGFFDTAGTDPSLLFRTKEGHDGAEPAGNSIAVWNLLRLAQMIERPEYTSMAGKTLSLFGHTLQHTPDALPQMLVAADFLLDGGKKQIILAGEPDADDTRRMLREIHRPYLPNKIILLADGGAGQAYLGRHNPVVRSARMIEGKATAYVCVNYACLLPTTHRRTVARLLEQ